MIFSSLIRYIHANYRFIVDPRGDYHSQAVDADVYLDWNNVLQILVSAQSQASSCPICLSTPVAPRMAKCGHIFCLPCLIRYMHSTDEAHPVPEKKARWKKCPICWDSIYTSETRPVRWFAGQEGESPKEGEDVVLRLIMRQHGSTLALPRDGAESLSTTEDIPWYYAAEVTDYARVMKGSEHYMLLHYDREVEELQRQEKEDELMFGEETQWTKKAVAIIIEAKEKIRGIGNPPHAPRKPLERKAKRPPIQFNETSTESPESYYIQHGSQSGQPLLPSPQESGQPSEIINMKSRSPPLSQLKEPDGQETPKNSDESTVCLEEPHVESHVSASTRTDSRKATLPEQQLHGDTTLYFYQALLHYYLSPLDIRILKTAFGDFASFPSTILPRVERVSTGHIVDDELRKRAKYLAHLPYGCEVGFLECDWTDTVVPEVLEQFSGEIERRRKRNKEKETREEKERARAEKEEDDKRWAAARRKRPSTSKEKTIEAEFQLLTEDQDRIVPSSSLDLTAASSSPPWLSSQRRNGSAFASLASPSTSPNTPKRTVWGTQIIEPSSPTLIPVSVDRDTGDNDGWLQGWERDLLQEEELIAQVQATSIGEGSSQAGALLGNSKKKKNKKITLMTTTARRGA